MKQLKNQIKNREIKKQRINCNRLFGTSSDSVKANEPVELNFAIKKGNGEIIKDFEIVHEKLFHLLIVSDDLKEFYHIHPEFQPDGTFKISFAFPNGGYYRLFADLTPKGNSQIVKNFTQIVVGNERAKEPLKIDDKFEKTVDGLRVVMNPDAVLENGKELMLEFQVFDAQTNQPVKDLENYLGAKAHFVVISQDLEEFVHAHPMSADNVKDAEHKHDAKEEKLNGADAQSIVSAHISFPKPAIYRVFAQFQRAGKVTTVPFTVEVKQGEAEKRLEKVEIPKGAFKIVVSKDGFTPEEVTFQKGQPLKLAFFRVDEENCGSEIVFKNLNIKKALPVGEVVLIDIPTNKTGRSVSTAG